MSSSIGSAPRPGTKAPPVFLSALLLILGAPAFSRAAFEPMGFGAAAKGAGGAHTAAVDDAYAAYWNPSALAGVKEPQLAAGWENLLGLDLVQYTTLAYAHPKVGGGSLGFFWSRLGTVGEAAYLDYAENVYALSYGRNAGSLRLGLSLKYFAAEGETRGSGMGADAVATLPLFKEKAALVVMARDFNQPIIHWENPQATVDRLPSEYRLAGAMRLGSRMRLSAERAWRGREVPSTHAGLSYSFPKDRFALRAGTARFGGNEWEVTAGAGVRLSSFQFDFAWSRQALGNTETASVVFRF